MLEGPTAIAFALEDPVGPAKVVTDFIREKRKGVVKGGIIDGRLFDPAGVEQLSKLPTKAVIMAQVAGALQSPLTSMAFCLQGVLGNFARALNALHDQKTGGAEAAEA
jgi:large subunit ribosomal protein L10